MMIEGTNRNDSVKSDGGKFLSKSFNISECEFLVNNRTQ